MRKIYLLIISVLVITNISVGQTTYTWIAGATGDYSNPASWSPARPGVPVSTDILLFNTPSVIEVTNVPNQTIGAITIAGAGTSVSLKTISTANVLTLSAAIPLVYSTPGSILSAANLTISLNNAVPFTMGTGSILGIVPGTGGKINISGELILSGGALNFDVVGTGGTTITATGKITYNSGSFASTQASAINWLSGSVYNHAANGSFATAIPTSSWSTGSNCTISGMNTGNISPLGLTATSFANFTWDCAVQPSDVDLILPAASTLTINGTFAIKNTGSSAALRLAGASSATISTVAYNQSGGRVMLQSGNGSTTLAVSGAFTQTGGIIDGIGNGASGGTATLDFKGDVTKLAGTWTSSGTNSNAQMNFQFSGSSPQNVTITGTWNILNAGHSNIIISNTNTTTGGGIRLTTGTVLWVINNNSVMAAKCMMRGVLSPSDGSAYVRYFGSGTGLNALTLEYNGAFFQNASAAEFPISATVAPKNLIINNSLGVTFPASFSRIIPGTLTMLNGNLAIQTGNSLSLTNSTLSNQLAYTAGYITTGTLERAFPATGLPSPTTGTLFPFGTGTNDRSFNIYFDASSIATVGTISVSHMPLVNTYTGIPFPFTDNGSNLDKRTNTYWTISTSGGFDLGTTKASIKVTGANIGVVNDITTLRLTDGVAVYGNLPTATGNTDIPVVGKSNLAQADIANKKLYIGGDNLNPLIIITFTWLGGTSSDWATAANWSGGASGSYPSAPTEIAIITSKTTFDPIINTGTNVSVYNLTVGTGMSLTMATGSVLSVYNDIPDFSGAPIFSPTSIFGYASSSAPQAIKTLSAPYGSFSLSGTGAKTFPAVITITGSYFPSGAPPIITGNTFIYAGSGAQTVAPGNYYNLTINGRPGIITLGTPATVNTIDIANVFDVSGLDVFNYPSLYPYSGTTVNFSSAGTQTVPGFQYGNITSTGNGARILDPSGMTFAKNVITVRSMWRGPGTGLYTWANSKVNMYVRNDADAKYFTGNEHFNDLTISGDLQDFRFDFVAGNSRGWGWYVEGVFNFTVNNFKQGIVPFNIYFDGAGDQTIPAFKTISARTPAFKYSNIIVQGGNRNITLAAIDTIEITGSLQVPALSNYYETQYGNLIIPFSAGKGFNVAGSTVSFSRNSGVIPLVIPSGAGTNNYNNVNVNGGTRNIGSNNMVIGGNLSVNGLDTLAATLNIGDGNTGRTLKVLGNISAAGKGSAFKGQIDLNTGTNGATRVNLGGSLSITPFGQLMSTTTTGTKNGIVLFNGGNLQTYSNTSTLPHSFVNFKVGDSLTKAKLTLLSPLNLIRSTIANNMGTLDVLYKDTLDCSTFNVISNGIGTAAFRLQDSATLITSNTGGVEGMATSPSDGSISNDGNIIRTYSDNASYTFKGTTITPFSVTSAITKMANLTIGANVTLDKSIFTSNTFTLGAFSFVLNNSDLTLTSTATNTAKVAPVPGGASVLYSGTGRFNVERYYPARRSWRLVTSPLSTTGTIYDTWQVSGADFSTKPNLGTYITGPNPMNGVDPSILNNVSMKMGSSLIPVTNTNGTYLSGSSGSGDNIGYLLFVRGDRRPANFNIANSNYTTLSSRGKLQIGTQNFLASSTVGSFTLIGNPYASPLSYGAAVRTNLANRVWVWDPYLNSSVGGYIVVEIDNLGVITNLIPGGPTTPGNLATIGQPFVVQSSQAFWVQTSSSGASVLFNEESKSIVYNATAFKQITKPVKSFRTNLYLVDPTDTLVLADGNLAQFDAEFSNDVNLDDVLKFGNINEMLAFQRNGKALSVERRKEIMENDTLFFKLTKTEQRNYQFQFVPLNMDNSLIGFLEDNYKHTRTAVSLTSTNTFNFSINGNDSSQAPDRFKIVFSAAISVGPLPVTYKSVKAYQQGVYVAIDWTVENEMNISKYEVEKSTDGTNYTKVNIIIAKGLRGSIDYKFLDNDAVEGNNYYRIVSHKLGGAFEYSRVVVVKLGKTRAGISVYPNPVTDNSIRLSMTKMPQGIYQLRLINTIGQTLMTKRITHSSGNSMETFISDSKISTGIYTLEVTLPYKKVLKVKVIIQ